MSLLDLATLASGVNDVLAWTRHLFALRIPAPHPHWHFRHRKLEIGHGWFRYETETAFRSEPRHAAVLTATARRLTPSVHPSPKCHKHGRRALPHEAVGTPIP
jgi:hypothetical protein